ncbi:polysaccharide biosynthesis tyrosine autokinase [Ectothiorhodospira shaposhnikovii]|uniref:polysaccharide biosynthesis tyrosine autokinase n=1 Tax=Ectothiorhodospira shaposhnikovii TaxID=1054 RepID=UPI001EE9592F|nr:polysaccharide biosynthesis tyrosine autokinase [Ectothiorhodospira shaposhnikovii]MCG5514353.1 polysaccharide biosynthesis tyrosine autokinase [Ectothiorhodospira shaposhnikovii]
MSYKPEDKPRTNEGSNMDHVTVGKPVETDGDTIDLSQILDFLLRGKWQIIGAMAAGLMAGGFLSWQNLPSYESSALLQVELKTPMFAFQLDTDFMPESRGIPTEIEIMQSRMVLGRVVSEQRLDMVVSPLSPPLLGRPLAGDSLLLSLPLLGGWLVPYAGYNAAPEVATLDFEGPWQERMVILETLGDGHFNVWTADESLLLARGTVDAPLFITRGDQHLALRVHALEALPGTKFQLRQRSHLAAIRDLRGRMNAREQGRQTGLVNLSVSAETPEAAARIANAIANAYQRQHVERRSEQARATLAFLEQQIPGLRREVELSEQALIEFLQSEGTVDLDRDASRVLNRLVDLDTRLTELQSAREESLLRLTPEHPQIQSMDRQIARLRQEMGQMEQEVSRLPASQQQLLALRRETQAATEIYVNFLNTAQELEIAQAGIVGSVRIIDPAVQEHRIVGTSTQRILLITGLLGTMLGVGLAFLLHAAGRRVHDPDQLEQLTGLPVHGVVPLSRLQRRLMRDARQGEQIHPLQEIDEEEPAVEAIRSLSTGLRMARRQTARATPIVITGPRPAVGKSFMSINLAAVLAQGGARVLVIDADLRRQSLDPYLPPEHRSIGLTEYLSGECKLEDAVLDLGSSSGVLRVLGAGKRRTRSFSLMMSPQFDNLLKDVADDYDYILIDTPPALMFADAAGLARHGMEVLVVLESSGHGLREVEETVKRLQRAGGQILGFVLNRYVPVSRGAGYHGYYGYSSYRYRYRYGNRYERTIPQSRKARSRTFTTGSNR